MKFLDMQLIKIDEVYHMFGKEVFFKIFWYIRKIELTHKTVQKRYKESYRFPIVLENSQVSKKKVNASS